MKEKIYFHNITRVLVSFCIFIITGRLSGLCMASSSGFGTIVAELVQFIISASCGVLSYIYFESLIPSPEKNKSEASVMSGRFRKRQFSMKRYVLETIPYSIATVMLLIISMYLVSISFDSSVEQDMLSEYNAAAAVSFISMVIIHPIAEEWLFRGLYYGELRSMNPIFACLMQAVMFAIVHNGVGGMMYALISGVILGVSAERSNGIAVPAAAHIIINLRTYIYNVGSLPQELLNTIDICVTAAGVISAVIIFLVAKKLPCQKPEKASENKCSVCEEANFED